MHDTAEAVVGSESGEGDGWDGLVDGGEENDQLLMVREEEQLRRHGILPLYMERSMMGQEDHHQAIIKQREEKRKLQELEERRVRMRIAVERYDELDVVRKEWWDMFCEDRDVGGSHEETKADDTQWQIIMEECERWCMGLEDKRYARKWRARVLRAPT